MRSRLMSVAAMLMVGLAGVGSDCPDPPVEVVALEGGLALDFGNQVPLNPVIGRRYDIFVGTLARQMLFGITATGLSAANRITVVDNSGAIVADFTADVSGPAGLVTVDGSRASIVAAWDGSSAMPVVRASGFRIRAPRSQLRVPTSIGGFEMSMNRPAELFLSSQTGDQTTYYLWVGGVRDRRLDVVVDGSARLFVGEPAAGLFLGNTGEPLGSAAPMDRLDGPGVVSFDSWPHAKMLLAVTNVGFGGSGGHVRVSVNEVFDIVDLNVWFRATLAPPVPTYAGRTPEQILSTMTSIAQEASRSLYQATAGRVRLGTVNVRVDPFGPASGAPKVDVRVSPNDMPGPEHVYGWQDVPWVSIELDRAWFQNTVPRAGEVLAHELMHYRYALPDEYRPRRPGEPSPPCTWCLCPASMMSEPFDELCFPGSHNPFGDPILSLATTCPRPGVTPAQCPRRGTNLSMWEILGAKLGFPAPTASPARVLKGVVRSPRGSTPRTTSVTLPLTVH